jgi:dephospho-CoA kinase
MPRIGVTGLMASGKTEVARRFEERGARIVDGDALGWEVLADPEVRGRIGGAFGPGVLAADGSVDRRALGRIVFGDASEMDRLNALVQPILERRVRKALEAPGGEEVVVLDAALLGAWNLAAELDGVVLVEAPEDTRVARLQAARGFPEAEARLRIEGQRLAPVRGARRTWRIDNHGSRAALLRRADEVWGEIEQLRSGARSE